MENAITTLSTTVSSDALWGVFADAIPYIGIVVTVGLGFYLAKKMLNGISKARTRVG